MPTMTLEQAFALAVEHQRAGRLGEAEQLCAQIVSKQPNHGDALHLLGIINCQTGRFSIGGDLLRRAVTLKPNSADAFCDLGNALTAQGKPREGIAALRRAMALNPNSPKIYASIGAALTAHRQFDEAIVASRHAISLRSGDPSAHCNLGDALRNKGKLTEAIAEYRQVVSLAPNFAGGYIPLASALVEIGELDEAMSICRAAIALNPNLPSAHSLLGMILLLTGNFREGWPEYEYRMLDQGFASIVTNVKRPRWDGSPLPNGTILLHAEQGFGDTLHFIRYVPMVAERCGKVIVICHPELQPVLRSMGKIAQWITPADPPAQFDAYCPLLSLPLIFGATVETIPSIVPYLRADAEKVMRWRERVTGKSVGRKIGITWAGGPTHVRDRSRSIPLSAFASLAQLPDVTFFSLQKGEGTRQAKNPPEGMTLVDWTHDLADFSDTAALIDNLDLVIAIDTAIVHLAGAMGKPVWTLLPFMPDWRWMLNREDTPWYPTMRLFRQPAIGDWKSVIEGVLAHLGSHK